MNINHRNILLSNIYRRIISMALVATIMMTTALAQGKTEKQVSAKAQSQPAAATAAATTPGRIARFATNGNVVDANISEDGNGRIGIGTTTPTSPLTVQGMIETTLGGYKFPDGSVQSTAGIASVFRDATLKGNGTQGSPLGIAVPLTLTGDTSTGSVLEVSNTATFGTAIVANGGPKSTGLKAQGGASQTVGGGGVIAVGGDSLGTTTSAPAGYGVYAFGGAASSGSAGTGIYTNGGSSATGFGGTGLHTSGGGSNGAGKSAGDGIVAYPGYGFNGANQGMAGRFYGHVEVNGLLSKAGGSFKIDHPLDPENKYLSHSFVESPDMKNVYDGVTKLDGNGEAIIEMPDWFSALNRDFRYLLTPIGSAAPGLFIAEELANDRFKIAGGAPGMKVSWQVTGIRQDAWANKNRIPVEEVKPERERGSYLHPEAFGKEEERGVNWAREPEVMRQLKQQRVDAAKAQAPRQ
jgi:hypothetical protein